MADIENPNKDVDPKLVMQGLEQAERLVNSLMEAEKEGLLPSDDELEKRHQKAVDDKAALQDAIDRKKKESASIKDSISAMKAECEAMTDARAKADRWVAMADEIRPMGEEIIALEAAISSLETQKMMVDQAIVMAEAQKELMKERLSANSAVNPWESKLEEIRQMKERLGESS